MPALTRADLLTAPPIWLLKISYAGRDFRFSSRPVEPVKADGELVPHDGGLDSPQYSEAFERFTKEPRMLSFPFRGLTFPVDIPDLESQGFDFGTATGELSQWIPGTDYERRRVVLTGDVVQPVTGATGEPVDFSLESNPYDDRALFPPGEATVTVTTWPALFTSEGFTYPFVFGTPGNYRDEDGTTKVNPGTPGILVRANTLMVAGHRCEATEVTVFDEDRDSAVFTIVEERDGLGRMVSTIDLTAPTSGTIATNQHKYFVGWHSGGGIVGDDGTLANGAGDLIEYLLRRSSLNIDYGRLASEAERLNARYAFSFYVDTPASPWELLRQHVLSWVPVTIRTGPNGAYPIVWRLDATQVDAVERLVAGENVSRVGRVTRERKPRDVVNAVSVAWAQNPQDRSMARRTLLTGDVESTDPDANTSRYSVVSHQRYGPGEVEYRVASIYDQSTASAVADWTVRDSGFIHRRVTYQGDASLGWIEPGRIVTLTDPDLKLADVIALVDAVRWMATGAVQLQLRLIPDLALETLTAA